MKRRAVRTMLVIVLASAAMVESARAQISYGTPATLDVGFALTNWTLDEAGRETTIQQILVPFTGFVPLRDNLEARYFFAYCTNEVTLDGGVHRLAGLSDLRIQINRSLLRDRLFLGLGVNLPTGKRGLDLDGEWLVANYLSLDFLTLPVRGLGEGLGFSATVGGVVDWRSLLLGATVAYEHAGPYESYQRVDDYDPGDQVNVSLRVERRYRTLRSWGNFVYANYTADTVGGDKVYDQNWYTRTVLGAAHETSSLYVASQLTYLVRDHAAIYDHDGATWNHRRLYGNDLVWRTNLELRGGPESRRWQAGPLAEFRWIEGSDSGGGRAAIQAYGADGSVTLTPRISAGLGLRIFTGHADGGGIEVGGYQVSATLTGAL